jgi:hypothetical protein
MKKSPNSVQRSYCYFPEYKEKGFPCYLGAEMCILSSPYLCLSIYNNLRTAERIFVKFGFGVTDVCVHIPILVKLENSIRHIHEDHIHFCKWKWQGGSLLYDVNTCPP